MVISKPRDLTYLQSCEASRIRKIRLFSFGLTADANSGSLVLVMLICREL